MPQNFAILPDANTWTDVRKSADARVCPDLALVSMMAWGPTLTPTPSRTVG